MSLLTTVDEVSVVFTATLLFGIYLTTLFFCLRWLIWADEGWILRRKIQWVILAVAILLCGCAATNLSLVVRKLMTEIKDPSAVQKPLPPTGKPVHTWEGIVECTTANVSALAADAVLIYRCWLIYSRSLRVAAFPILMWIGGLICTILQIYWQLVEAAGLLTAWQPVNSVVGPGTVLTPFWASTILLNAFATVAITRRLWSIAKDVEGATSTSSLKFVSRVMAESGVLYLLITIAHFIVWFTPSSFAISVVSNINIPIIGIAYNLIIIRTAQEKAKQILSKSSARQAVSSLHFATYHGYTRRTETETQIDNTGTSMNNTLAIESTASGGTDEKKYEMV